MKNSTKGLFELNEIEAFNNIIKTLSDFLSLSQPQPNCTTYELVTDSSKYAVGVALHRLINGNPIPIGFFSKKLSQTHKIFNI